jgi:Ca2+-binding EF-hand superfamily protein
VRNNRGEEIMSGINVSALAKLFEASEVSRSNTSVYGSDQINVSSARYSSEALFRAADKNNDMKVTREELENTIKTFDKNNDNELSSESIFKRITGKKGELQNFNRNFGEKLVNYSNVSF